ncbi:MAG TPA: hypothetical protein VM120_15520 [Bryobacteraceae bacterium]|nr:hypothetical protein [Bryobacteraceae bacterium]
MSFYEKYELVEVLRDDGVKTFQAREIANGRIVEVHLIVGQPGKSEPPYDLLEKVRAFGPESSQRILEIGDQMGTPYIVTLPLEASGGFREWVAKNSAPKPAYDPLARVGRWKLPAGGSLSASPTPPPPPSTPSMPPPIQRPAAGDAPDITRMFNTAELVIPKKTAPPAPGSSTDRFATPSMPPPAPAPPAGDDEFDRLFMAQASKAPAAPPAAPPVPPAPAKLSGPPDDTTRMFFTSGEMPVAKQTPPASSGTAQMKAAKSPAAAKKEPGEFTRMFQVPSGTAQMKAPEPAKTADPAKTGAGEFTSMFQTPSPTGEAKAAAPVSPPPAKPTELSKPPQPAAKEPGEFTKMFQVPSATGEIKAPQFTKQPEPAKPPPSPSATGQMKSAVPADPKKEAGEFTRMFEAASSTGQMKAPEPKVPPAASTGQMKAPPGEFTQMFEATQTGAPAKQPPPTKQPPSTPAPGPGEFTRMFQAPQQLAGEPPPPASVAPPFKPAPSPAAGKPPEAGEFTRMFPTSPGHPSGEPPRSGGGPPPPAIQEPGEFTRMFSSPPGAPKQPLPMARPDQGPGSQPNPFAAPTAPLPQPMVPPAPGLSPFGQQTSPFGQPSTPFGQTPQAPQPGQGFGAIPQRPYAAHQGQPSVQNEYEKLFGGSGGKNPSAPMQPGPLPTHGAHQPPPIPPMGGATQAFQTPQFTSGPAAPAGPSEYTRMFNAPKDVQAPAPAAPAPIVPPAPPKTAKWPFFVFGGVILLLLIGLAFTLLRK